MVYLRLWRLGQWIKNYFRDIDLSNEFEPVEFSIEDYDPKELNKLIDKLNDELEPALEKAEKQLFND